MLKKLLLAGSCICLLACGEQTSTDSSNSLINAADGSNQSSLANVSNRPTVTAQQLIDQPRDYIFENDDGFNWTGEDAQCAGVEVEWMQILDDTDIRAEKRPTLRLDDQTLDITLQTKSQGEQSISIDREQLKLHISIVEYVWPSRNEVKLDLDFTDKTCASGEGLVFSFSPDVINLLGVSLQPKIEIVALDVNQPFFEVLDRTPYLLVENCKQGLALYLNENDDLYKRAQIKDGALILESGDFWWDDISSFSIDLDDSGLEPAYEEDGYRVSYRYDACGQQAVASFSLTPVSEEQWQNL